MTESTVVKGGRGEAIAAGFLRSQGCRILTANYRCRFGEIDLVVQEGPVFVFVEIKARHDARYGRGALAVTQRKQRRIIKTAEHYLMRQPQGTEQPARFDVLEIDLTNPDTAPTWYRSAFEVSA